MILNTTKTRNKTQEHDNHTGGTTNDEPENHNNHNTHTRRRGGRKDRPSIC